MRSAVGLLLIVWTLSATTANADLLRWLLGPTAPGASTVKNFNSFQGHPGISREDLIISRDVIAESWQAKLLKLENNSDGIDFGVFYNLNIEAAELWAEMIYCQISIAPSRESVERLLQSYLNKNIDCGEKTNAILERLKLLHVNVKNWVESDESRRIWLAGGYANKKDLVPWHPLLGQVVVEALGYYKLKTYKFITHGLPQFFQTNISWASSAIMSCQTDNATHTGKSRYDIPCAEAMPLLRGLEMTSRLLDAGTTLCTTYGFWPNSSIYLYAVRALVRPYEISYIHPALNKSASQRSISIEEFEFVLNGEKVKGAYFIFSQPSGEPYIRLQQFRTNYEQEYLTAATEHFKSKKSGSASMRFGSCWSDSNVIIGELNQPIQIEDFNLRNHGVAEFYANLYQYYSGL